MFRPSRWVTRWVVLPITLMFLLSLVGCGGTKKDETTVITEEIEKEKGFTLVLVAGATGQSLSCTLSKGLKKDEDHVRWLNQTTGPVTIQFTTITPFLETETSFVVPAGKFSPYYSLDTVKGNAGYDYTTTPALVSGGPTQPTISVGD